MGFADVFDASQLTADRAAHIPGARFTPDAKYADYYRNAYGKDARLVYIDVPKADAERGRVSDSEVKIDVARLGAAIDAPLRAEAEQAFDADPIAARARKAAASNPDMVIPLGEFLPDGTPATARAADLIARADAELQAAQGLGPEIFRTAAACMLGAI